jgi:hypothetical protein
MSNGPVQKRSQEGGIKKKHIGLTILKEQTIPFSPNDKVKVCKLCSLFRVLFLNIN